MRRSTKTTIIVDAVLLYLSMFSVFPVCCCWASSGAELGLNLLRSPYILYVGNKNDEKRDNSARNDAYIPQLKACDGRKSKEDGKSPDEGEHCANSPGRHNLLILEVEKQGGVSVQAYRR